VVDFSYIKSEVSERCRKMVSDFTSRTKDPQFESPTGDKNYIMHNDIYFTGLVCIVHY
jgi:hypothetical protein